jgi:flagellar motility protein MotE (MotC chaperone)
MKLRLIPLLLFAATSLLTLKAFDMVFSGEALLSGATSAQAEEKKQETKTAAAEPAKTAAEVPKDEKPHSLLEGTGNDRPKEKITLPQGEESAEAALGERLGEKRRALEDRTKEMDLRENLLKTAEKKLDERMAELKKLEAQLDEQAKVKEEQAGLQIKSLVLMYETMKPKEAAAIFDKLDMNVMIEVASRMKPQVTSAVLAKMTIDTAQKLTTELARRSLAADTPVQLSASGGKPQAFGNTKELPRIDNPPPKQN